MFVSGIGCSSRFPYYLDTYGMHSIHGRAPSIATGIATAREDLSVWVVTGDGDALSIGGNHLIHALRRNVNMTILLFNNRIYGLTKGQYSPTSEAGKITKSTPMGSVDHPFNPVSLALGAEGSFVARTIDSDRKHLTSVLSAAAAHRGTSFVEIYQNCPIFNDGAFDAIKNNDTKADAIIPLVHGEPIRFGVEGAKGLVRDTETGGVKVVEVADVGEDAILVHDAHNPDPTTAFAISRLTDSGYLNQSPIGIFRQVERPTYDDGARAQIASARDAAPGEPTDRLAGAHRRRRHLDGRLSAALAAAQQGPRPRAGALASACTPAVAGPRRRTRWTRHPVPLGWRGAGLPSRVAVRGRGLRAVGRLPALLAAARAGRRGGDPRPPGAVVRRHDRACWCCCCGVRPQLRAICPRPAGPAAARRSPRPSSRSTGRRTSGASTTTASSRRRSATSSTRW